MCSLPRTYSAILIGVLVPLAAADTIKLKNGNTMTGVIVQEDSERVTIAFQYGTCTLLRGDIESIAKEPVPAKSGEKKDKTTPSTARIPGWSEIVSKLTKAPWAKQFRQVPATVVDLGVLKDVPYMSYRCGADYEVNVYGDPDAPAGVEIGVYRQLLKSDEAKNNCVDFIASILTNETDQRMVKALDVAKDLVTRAGLTFEITPETAEDAYGGWWVSVYDEAALDKARASPKELEAITVTRDARPDSAAPATKSAKKSSSADSRSIGETGWSTDEMKLARPTKSTGSGGKSTGGRVYVRSYHRQDGTYVHAHTRRR